MHVRARTTSWLVIATVSALVGLGPKASNSQSTDKPTVVYLNQAWSAQDRADYYWTSQGSALLSYDIYLALAVAGSDTLFNSPASAETFGLLLDGPDPKNNPDGLAIGITKAVVSSGQFKGVYAGVTCAACHTGQVQYKGQQIRLDGGINGRIELPRWIKSLSASLDATLSEPARFQRLLQRVRARGPADEADLRMRLRADANSLRAIATEAFLEPFDAGPGRVDALGDIHNAFAAVSTGIRENSRPTIAPVKPPFVWNAPQSAWVQWSGIVNNPLPRNFGETLGVFARYDLKSASPDSGLFETTSDVKGLIKIEHLLRRLAPPQWPEAVLGKLDQAKAAQGKELFTQNCAECHAAYPYRWSAELKQGKRMIENALVPLSVVGTDDTQFASPAFDPRPTMLTGPLAPLFDGHEVISKTEMTRVLIAPMLRKAVERAGPFTSAELIDMNGYANFGDEPLAKGPVRSYKAAPRDGVWGTGPFLHNGSVPNMYELLSPASARSKTFPVGRDFDPVKLGLDTSQPSGSYLFDTALVGNSNAGHSFQSGSGAGIIGRELTEAERYAMIEYLKSIPNEPGRVTAYGGPEKPLLAADDPTWFNTKDPY